MYVCILAGSQSTLIYRFELQSMCYKHKLPISDALMMVYCV